MINVDNKSIINPFFDFLNPGLLRYAIDNEYNLEQILSLNLKLSLSDENHYIEKRQSPEYKAAGNTYDEFIHFVDNFGNELDKLNGINKVSYILKRVERSKFCSTDNLHTVITELWNLLSNKTENDIRPITRRRLVEFIMTYVISYKLKCILINEFFTECKLFRRVQSYSFDRISNDIEEIQKSLISFHCWDYSEPNLKDIQVVTIISFLSMLGKMSTDKVAFVKNILPIVGLNIMIQPNRQGYYGDSLFELARSIANNIFVNMTNLEELWVSDVNKLLISNSNKDIISETFNDNTTIIGERTGVEDLYGVELTSKILNINPSLTSEYISEALSEDISSKLIDYQLTENDIGFIKEETTDNVAILGCPEYNVVHDAYTYRYRYIIEHEGNPFVLFKVINKPDFVYGISINENVNDESRKIIIQPINTNKTYKYAKC